MKKYIFFGFLSLLIMFAGYFAFVYYVPFSEGYRAGELIKISKKGVLLKTWEGEISQGISGAQIFSFSVMDNNQEVIDQLVEYQGEYVEVTYVERYLTFPWWGDTRYFVTSVKLEDSPHFK